MTQRALLEAELAVMIANKPRNIAAFNEETTKQLEGMQNSVRGIEAQITKLTANKDKVEAQILEHTEYRVLNLTLHTARADADIAAKQAEIDALPPEQPVPEEPRP